MRASLLENVVCVRYHKHYICKVFYWLESMLEVSSGLLDVFWKPLGDVLTTFCDRLDLFWALLEGFGVFWKVLDGTVLGFA